MHRKENGFPLPNRGPLKRKNENGIFAVYPACVYSLQNPANRLSSCEMEGRKMKMRKAWYFNPSNRVWVEIRGTSIIGVHLARALGYRVAIAKVKT